MKRLFESGAVTTIIGVVLIALGAYMYVGELSEVAAGGLTATGVIFLRSKDSLIGLK